MIIVNYGTELSPKPDVNIEYPQINRNSVSVNAEPIFVEKTTIDGTTIRRLKGYRLTASWSYPYLFKAQRQELERMIIAQAQVKDGITLKTDIPFALSTDDKIQGRTFVGKCFLDLSESGRFGYSPTLNDYVWTGVQVTAVASQLIEP